MSSSKGFGKPSNSYGKQKATSETTIPMVDEINLGIGGIGLNSEQNDGWEVYARKSKNKGGSSAGKPWVPPNPSSKAWGHQDVVQKSGMRNNAGSGRGSGNNWSTPNDRRKPAGRGNSKPQLYDQGFDNRYTPSPLAVPPALKNGWDWSSTAASAHLKDQDTSPVADDFKDCEHDREDNESDLPEDSEDELLSDDDDSDGAEISYEERKKKPWFRGIFDLLDSLPVGEINDPARPWHCPACKGGPGEVEWFTGFQALLTHAKTKIVRVKLHRELATLLEEELQHRGTSVVMPGEMYRKWGGRIEYKDKEIVWPPMVVIMNTRVDKDENDKWIGMGNQEMLDYCSSYAAVKAQHSYGPQGHRGMSVVIFEASPVGYYEAERLSEYFSKEGRNRDAWERLKYPVQRQLYGYMAEKRDIDNFNKHSPGKSRLKFEMRSYLEKVSEPVKQMWEENQQLTWYKNQAAKFHRQAKALEESNHWLYEKLDQALEENKILRQRTMIHNEQTKEEREYQEQFFTDHIKEIYDIRTAEQEKFEKIQKDLQDLDKQANANTSSVEDYRRRAERVAQSINLHDKEMEEFLEESEEMIRRHEERIAAVRRGHWEEEIALKKEIELELAGLKEKYSPRKSEQVDCSGSLSKEPFVPQSGASRRESKLVAPQRGYRTSGGNKKKNSSGAM